MQLAQNLISCTHLFKEQNAVIVRFRVLCLYYSLSVSELDLSLYSPKHSVWLGERKQWLQLHCHCIPWPLQRLSFPTRCLLKFCPPLAVGTCCALGVFCCRDSGERSGSAHTSSAQYSHIMLVITSAGQWDSSGYSLLHIVLQFPANERWVRHKDFLGFNLLMNDLMAFC